MKQLLVFFKLASGGCPVCKAAYNNDPSFFVDGSCFKAKLLCPNKHLSTWNSSEGATLEFIFIHMINYFS